MAKRTGQLSHIKTWDGQTDEEPVNQEGKGSIHLCSYFRYRVTKVEQGNTKRLLVFVFTRHKKQINFPQNFDFPVIYFIFLVCFNRRLHRPRIYGRLRS